MKIQSSFKDNVPKMYIMPTPIGNMDDVTDRVMDLLYEVDYVFCEDTREFLKFIKDKYEGHYRFICNEYTEIKYKGRLKTLFLSGSNIAVISDRGTPLISDPGYNLSQMGIDCGYNVITIPGANAIIPALVSSGLAPYPFTFIGFLKGSKKDNEQKLEYFKSLKHSLVFYVAAHDFDKKMKLLYGILGDRNCSIGKELTKIHETYIRGKLSEIIDFLRENELKGEFVVIVDGSKEVENYEDLSIVEHVDSYQKDGLGLMESIKKVSSDRHIPKSTVYKKYHDERK